MELDTTDETSTQTLKPNGFIIAEDEGYAWTNIEMSEIAEILMTKLEPVELEDLDPDDRACAICCGELLVSEDPRISHDPVKTGCGHVFGKKCIIRWLDPFCFWGLKENDDPEATDACLYEPTNSGCPVCRRGLCPRSPVEPMEVVAHRLAFWDMAYDSTGVERSEKEERSRKYMWQYIEYCRSIDEHEVDRQMEREHRECAQMLLLDFALYLKKEELTPEQEILREKLERIAKMDLDKFTIEGGKYVFDTDRDDDNERVEFPHIFMEIDKPDQ